MTSEDFMQMAIRLSQQGMENNQGGPFGAVIVKNGEVAGTGNNQVLAANDPTAHAEVVAIRNACTQLGTFDLTGCEIYCSCEPCPMCLAAIYWARIAKIYYANTRRDAAGIGFDDDLIYTEIPLPPAQRKIPATGMLRHQAQKVFKLWQGKPDKQVY